jgi:hypothetical protein
MSNFHESWSNDTQAHTQMAILQSQLEVVNTALHSREAEIELLKLEIINLNTDNDRLELLLKTLTEEKK